MRLIHSLYIVALCVSLAQFEPRNVSFELLPTLADPTERNALNAYDFAPFIEVESPLYRAIINRETRSCVWITFRVRAEDVVNDNDTDRGWWRPVEMADYVLESEDYTSSGYDRGHLRSIQMSRGSEHWQDVNCLAVIVPELPELNRGPISQLESRICEIATSRGWCQVTITLTGDVGDMPRADEPHAIPETIRYLIESPEGVESIEFSNVEGD